MRALVAALFLGLCACYPVRSPELPEPSSFLVKVDGIFAVGTLTSIPVVTVCSSKYGGDDKVPSELRGTQACPYAMPRGTVEMELNAVALDHEGHPYPGFTRPVAWRAVPGDLTGDYPFRWTTSIAGVSHGRIQVAHLFGEVQVWAEDAPPLPIYSDGGIALPTDGGVGLPPEGEPRTYATGLSQVLYFEEPTVAKVQLPDGFDNRSSPLEGQFLTIGRPPESGSVLVQSCSDDPDNDQKPIALVVTGMDPGGFFVTDLTACHLKEQLVDPTTGQTVVRTPEPNGYLPSTFGHMYVYNYSYPDGLDQGDLLFSLSGAIQEFASTTQITFPSWSIADHVRRRPPEEWNKWLQFVKPIEINLRTCGLDNQPAPFLTDTLCGHNKRNMKLESAESALVRIHDARPPDEFVNCDLNGDNDVPYFCETKFTAAGCPEACGGATPYCNVAEQKCQAEQWGWRDCSFDTDPLAEAEILRNERLCNIDCTIGRNAHRGHICAEQANFRGFGQWVVEMAGPGPAQAGLDEALPVRSQVLALSGTAANVPTPYVPVTEITLYCTAPAHFAIGDNAVVATTAAPLLPANTLQRVWLAAGQTSVSVIAEGTPPAGAQCTVSENPRTRINLVTKDSLPELQPDCSVADPDPTRAEQCTFFRGATYDVIGHLRQVQPARPRWAIIPRDPDDVCCHPGPGLSCPRPIKPCK